MGDFADASIELFGVQDRRDELGELLHPLVFVDMELNTGVLYAIEELAYGEEEVFCAALRERRISYVFFQCADHEHTAVTRLFTPELGEWSGPSSAEGEPVVTASNIDAVLDQMPTDADDVWLREELEVAGAAAWRSHFARLRAENVHARYKSGEVQ